MIRPVATVVTLSLLLMGCSTTSLVVDEVDPPCRGHADPSACQAALDAAMPGLGSNLDGYDLTVGPISCADGRCTTWVAAYPTSDEECRPSWEAEVSRPPMGAWQVESTSHGDPPCAFE